VVKLGAAFTSGSWTWRAGWNHGDNPIPDTETFFNILAPGVVEDHLTFGFTKRVGSNNEINFSYMHALKNEVTGPLPVGLGGGTGSIEMYQNSLEISLGTKF
jgi:long-chain fatty acid transport protein